MTTDSPQSNNEAATAPAGGVSVNDLPPEALTFATRLFNAARTGDCEIFEQVLAYNAGVKDLRNEKGDTLIMLAAYHGHAPLVRLLLRYGSNPDILNDRQQSPLAGAIFKGEKEVVEALLDGGADPAIGEPSARDAVKIFRQEAVWAERLGMGAGEEKGEQ